MSLILNEKYKGAGSYRLFLTNRLLRIFPAYLVILAASAAVMLLPFGAPPPGAAYLDYFGRLNPLSLAAMLLTNLCIFGQDVVMFLGIDPRSGALYFTSNFWVQPLPAFRLLLVPQAWSIGAELLFYVLAPFLVVRRTRVIAGIVVLTVALRAALALGLGLTQDPWTYRFFPVELGTFLCGALSYRAYGWLRSGAVRLPRACGPTVTGALALLIVNYQRLPITGKRLLLYAAVSAALPVIFHFTKSSRWDRRLGELSYPLYLAQWLVLCILYRAGVNPGGPLLAVATVLFSFLIVRFIERPIDGLRQRRLVRRASVAVPRGWRVLEQAS